MSLNGALLIGVSGLKAQSAAIGAVSDNISNVNTIGYKGTKVNFNSLVNKHMTQDRYVPGGVLAQPRMGVSVQGLLQSTNSTTDFALSGNGFMVVSNSPRGDGPEDFAFTRAGSFQMDADGFLRNTSGFYMRGWPLIGTSSTGAPAGASTMVINGNTYMKGYKDANGNVISINDKNVSSGNLFPLNVGKMEANAVPTRNANIAANLPSAASLGTRVSSPISIYDSLGTDATLQLNWRKQDTNDWTLHAVPPKGARSVGLLNGTTQEVNSASGRLDFLGMPQTGSAINMQIGSHPWTFRVGPDADETWNSVMYTKSDGSVGSFVDNLASDIDLAFRLSVESSPITNSYGAGKQINVHRADGNVVSIDMSNATDSYTTCRDINAQSSKTGIYAAEYPLGQVVLYAKDTQSIKLTDETGAPFTTVNGTGKVYCEALGDGNALAFYQDSTVGGPISISGLNSTGGFVLADGNPAIAQGKDQGGDPNSFTVSAVANANPALRFSGDGTPAEINVSAVEIDWSTGANDMVGKDNWVGLSLGNLGVSDGMTQLDGPYNLKGWSQNGARYGNYAGLSVGDTGIVTALFDNGVARPIFQIPVATFSNPNALESLSGNIFRPTNNSGDAMLRMAGNDGAGTLNAASLEASTVDLGTEFTTMIVAQRAYTAATKIITTTEEMIDEANSLKR